MDKEVKVLLIDDEPDFTKPMAFWFSSKGYYVITASDGEKGLELIKEKKPDIVFLDLNMPGMDGVKTLEKIREFDKELPVIVVSAYVDEEKIKKLHSLGISGVFYKTQELEAGLTLLEATLRRHKKFK